MKWTKRDITKLKKLWKEGLTGKEIASKMKRSTGSVVMKIHALQKSGLLLYRHKGKNESKKTQKEWKGYSPLEIKTLKDAYKYVDDVTKEATTKVVVHTATNPSDVFGILRELDPERNMNLVLSSPLPNVTRTPFPTRGS